MNSGLQSAGTVSRQNDSLPDTYPSCRVIGLCLAFLCLHLSAAADTPSPTVIPLPQAHAHNDYAHARPLLDALDCGFCSVEADIWLTNGQLLVAHNLRDVRRERTLDALYLKPLHARVRQNGGRVFPGGINLTLLIDIKSEAAPTYHALCDGLKAYTDMLTVFREDRIETNAVTIILSGNTPTQDLLNTPFPHDVGYDGRPAELSAAVPPMLMPLISDVWSRHFKWRGKGPFPAAEQERLRALVAEAHRQGKRIRFWALPDNPAGWRALSDAGVDLINTDRLSDLRDFLLDLRQKRERLP